MHSNRIFSKKTKHLYLHVPFCNHICTYCDFKRILRSNDNKSLVQNYLANVVRYFDNFNDGQFSTIYLGGGTPNCLTHDELVFLLEKLSVKAALDCEFSIECNPDLITQEQIDIFKKFRVNRISIGVQSTNNRILKQINRVHTIEDVYRAIELLHKNQIFNLSLDFIYNLTNLTYNDIDDVFRLVEKYQIPHLSFYALEIKSGSLMKKMGITIDVEEEENQLLYINQQFAKKGYLRYEVSNFARSKSDFCKHNLAYWNMNDYVGLGYGAYGFENQISYHFDKPLDEPKLVINEISNEEYYQYILMMGLRLNEGINLEIERNTKAYLFFKDKLQDVYIENNHLKAVDLNLLHNALINIF